jgi:hypothetical protein
MWLLFPLIALVLLVVLAIGAVVAVVTTAALVLAAVLHAVPILLILVAGWWLAKALFGPRRPRWERERTRQARPAWTPRSGQTVYASSSQRQATQKEPAPRQPAASRRPASRKPELPIDVQVKVEQIRSKADVLASYADRFPPFSQDLYIVRQTTADYLPRTVDAYLAIPYTDDRLLGASSTAALEELRSQLDLLDARLDDIARDLQRHDLDDLLANRRFLEERFGLRDQPAEPTAPGGQTGAA